MPGLAAFHLQRAGLHVVSTLDWALQQQAEQAMRDGVAAARGRGVRTGSMVAVQPASGDVLALVGSADPETPNGARDLSSSPTNSGNVSRLFTYAAAIASRRYTMATPVADAPLTVDLPPGTLPYRPRDFDQRWHGTCRLEACLGSGLNVPAVEVELGLGIPEVVRTSRSLGAPPRTPHFQPDGGLRYTDDDPDAGFGASLTLGGYGQTPLQLAAAMAALAAGGRATAPGFVRSVRTASGAQIPVRAPPASRALDPAAAFVVSQMLADDESRALVYGRGSPLTLPGPRVAALTGDTEVWAGGWTLGYTPSLASVVWMGDPAYRQQVPLSAGVFLAAPTWNRFMQGALDRIGRGDEWFTPPPGVRSETVDGRPAWFLDGTGPDTPAPPLPPSVHSG